MRWKPKVCVLGTAVLLCTSVLVIGEVPVPVPTPQPEPTAIDADTIAGAAANRAGQLMADVAASTETRQVDEVLSVARPRSADETTGRLGELGLIVQPKPSEQRGRSTRALLPCPPDALFSQPADDPDEVWTFGVSDAGWSAGGGARRYEDFSGVSGDICDLHWWGAELVSGTFANCDVAPAGDNTEFEIIFYEDDGGLPGAAVCTYTLEATRVDTGLLWHPTLLVVGYEYSVVLAPCCTLSEGWISIMSTDTTDCGFWWLSSGGAGNGYHCMETPFGTSLQCGGDQDFDLAMCFTGEYVPIYGACCDDSTGVCVDDVEMPDCPAPLRFAEDTLCVDLDPPCGEIYGACCVGMDCFPNKTEAECYAEGGTIWFEGIGCEPNPCPYENDACETAVPIYDGATPTDTTEATTDGPAHPECQFDGQTYNDIWYTYEATCTGKVTVAFCQEEGGNAWYDTDLVIYDGCDCEDLVLLECNDDAASTCTAAVSYTSRLVDVPVLGGNCYLLRVGGYGASSAGLGLVAIACEPDPTGACCLGGDCVDDQYQGVCEAGGGTYAGDDSVCPTPVDCQPNGDDDFCDILTETSGDCNENGIPDECESAADCDLNGVLDICDPDCNENGIPDGCDTDCGVGNCNTPDCYQGTCGASEDCQPDGVPDECQLGEEGADYEDVLCSTFLTNNGHAGNMFDVTILASAGVVIESFDGNFGTGPTAAVEVYFRTDHGSYVGHNTDPNGWTLMGSATVPVNPSGTPTPVPIGSDEVFLEGETVGFYFTRTDNTGGKYTNGPLDDFVNDDMIIHGTYGHGGAYPFNNTFTPRIWNGCIYYNYGGPGGGEDCNENGIPDECDIMYCPYDHHGNLVFTDPLECADCQEDGIPDGCQLVDNDCQPDGIPDDCQLEGNDCQPNEIPDECEVPPICPGCPDCNADGIPDECQLEGNDCNGDGIPDDCQLVNNDWNANGVPDDCEPDCNNNGLVDECDVEGGCGVGDCADPGAPAPCGGSLDCQPNNVPDECEIGAAAASKYVYLWDDGTSENGLGLTAGGEMAWINHFDTQPGENQIGVIRTVFGYVGGSPGVNPGDTIRLFVWDDPVGNGDATDAVLLAETTGTADAGSIGTDVFQDFSIGPVTVGDSFFIGVAAVHAAGGFPYPMDENGPQAGEAWLAYAVAPAVFDPTDMSGALSMTAIGYPCNAMIRAETGAGPGPGAGDCNGNGTPDDCDIQYCPYNHLGGVAFENEAMCQDCQPDGIPDGCQLGAGSATITVKILTDYFGYETTWEMIDGGGGIVGSGGGYSGNTLYTHDIIVESPFPCPYEFTIYDSYGDGTYAPGGYEISIDGNLVATTMGNGWCCWSQTVGDICPPPPPGGDCNENEIPDDCDIMYCDGSTWCRDCQEDGIPDGCQLEGNDCNENGIPDECDIADCDGSGWCTDCNENGIPDGCEGLSDCDGDGMWDICDPDCNENGTSDVCDILWCTGEYWCLDCQPDGVPDGGQLGGEKDRQLTYHFSARGQNTPPNHVYMLDETGAAIGSYEQLSICATDAWGYRDGAGDGSVVYFGCAGGVGVHSADGTSGEVIITGGAPGGVSTWRALAYDNETLWTASFSTALAHTDLEGNLLESFPNDGWSLYGLALDASDGNLWGHDGLGTVIKIDTTTGTIIPGEGWPSAFPHGTAQGGLSNAGGGNLAAVMQSTPDLLGVYDLTGAMIIGPWDLDAVSGETGNLGVGVTGYGGAGCIPGEDCNGNLIPDECDLMYCPEDHLGNVVFDDELLCSDCQEDEIPDGCQLEGNDCQGDLTPDECQLFYAAPPPPPCADPDATITVEIQTDSWGSETSWTLAEQGVGTIAAGSGYASNSFYSTDVPVCSANCYDFTINDSWGDGIYSPGGYRILYNGEVVADKMGGGFTGSMETVTDIACDNPGVDNDCNVNEIPDECDIPPLCEAGVPGFPEECSEDCQPNAIPDECEPDCNENAIPDDCDLRDCPRETEGPCEGEVLLGSAWCDDCNDNGTLDYCDLYWVPPPPEPDAIITVVILTDTWGGETSWQLAEQGGGIVETGSGYANNTLYTIDVGVYAASCYEFTIFDSYGDGIYSPGGYEIYYEGGLVASTMGGGFTGSIDIVSDIGGGCGGAFRACDEIIYDSGDCDGVNGTRPTVGWNDTGIVDDFAVPQNAGTDFSCIHVEILDFAQTDMPVMRARVYALPTNNIPIDLPNFDAATPVCDMTYSVAEGTLTISDRDPCYPGALAWDYDAEGPVCNLDPGTYALLVNFPGSGAVNYWASSANDGTSYGYVWGQQVQAPSIGSMNMAWKLLGASGPPPPPPNDCNTNGIPDECDLDCNGNGVADDCEEDPVTCSAIEVKGDACPAPFNRGSHGVTPVTLFGDANFDVTDIDLATIRMVRLDGEGGAAWPNEGPPGPSTEVLDMGTPFYPSEPCECGANNQHDGILDLKMKFRTEVIVEQLDLVSRANGTIEEVVIIGNMCNGNPFMTSSYCLLFVPQVSNRDVNVASSESEAYVDVTPPDMTYDEGGFTNFTRAYDEGTTVTLTAEPTLNGKVFAGWVVDGVPDTSGSLSISVVTNQVATAVEARYSDVSRLPAPAPRPTPAPRPVPRPVGR